MSSLQNMSNWQLYQSFTDINKKLWTKLEMARRRNQIPTTSETNLYFANIMLIAFCVQPPAIFLHSGGKFPSCSETIETKRPALAILTNLRGYFQLRRHFLLPLLSDTSLKNLIYSIFLPLLISDVGFDIRGNVVFLSHSTQNNFKAVKRLVPTLLYYKPIRTLVDVILKFLVYNEVETTSPFLRQVRVGDESQK